MAHPHFFAKGQLEMQTPTDRYYVKSPFSTFFILYDIITEEILTFANNMEDIAIELSLLHSLSGIQFVKQLEKITQYGGFDLVQGETAIYSVGGEHSDDYEALLEAAHKAVDHGYTVYFLPNPRAFRTADFIFEKKGVYTMYDLKTVYGKGSVGTQLLDSIGQSNRILLNMKCDYNARLLAADIKAYFEANRKAVEVLLFKGKKIISVNRYATQSPMFHRQFRKKYEQ